MAQRQEALNVLLAQLLQERGLAAAPEQILSPIDENIQMPDVLIDFQGLRLAIEAEFGSRTLSAQKAARKKAFKKAESRVETGVAHIGIAVVYPPKLKMLAWPQVHAALANSEVDYAIVNEVTALETQLHLFDQEERETQFFTGKLDDFFDALRRSYEQLVRDDTLDRAVTNVEVGLAQMTRALWSQPAASIRIAEALGVADYKSKSGKIKKQYTDPLNKIAALIVTNALIFHEVLSAKESAVTPLHTLRNDATLLTKLTAEWDHILREINYFPIFATALHLLKCLNTDQDLVAALRGLIDTALKIVACRASLRHDLAGRIYHRLLEEAKYLGAYYTAIPSATLLLKLALNPAKFPFQWTSIPHLKDMRIADLASGTGTLLMASADVITDNYVRACVAAHKSPDVTALQKALVADVIYGYDVLASAVHLTASTLTLRVPDSPVDVTHLYAMPLGGRENALGSLEFIASLHAPGTLFGVVEQVAGKGKRITTDGIPPLDLCVMNPPFTRSVGGNLLFGNLPDERHGMQKRLKALVKINNMQANITAGLGPVFVALGDIHIKPGGCLALVLPKALLSGPAWEKTRRLISDHYSLEYIITSHEPGKWNFSENTKLSEVLVVARKNAPHKPPAAPRTIYVNLHRQLSTSIEALAVARAIASGVAPDLATTNAPKMLMVGNRNYGQMVSLPWREVQGNLWGVPASFATFELNKALYALRQGHVYLPGGGEAGKIALKPLGALVRFGYDARDVHDAFELAGTKTSYPALWSHETGKSTHLIHPANNWLTPLAAAKPGRKLKSASAVFAKAGRMLFAERLRLNTVRTPAILCPQRVIANTWWPATLRAGNNINHEKALVLWQNSTLGMLLLIGHRVETEGGWVKFKKPVLEGMPALDVGALGTAQLNQLGAAFDNLAKRELLPIRLAASDSTRQAINAALAQTLNLPDVSPLTQLLVEEPMLCSAMIGGSDIPDADLSL